VHFDLTDDQRMLADSLTRFLREQYGFAARQRICASPAGCDRAMWQRFADLGVLAALFTEADGGYGGTGFDVAAVFEELGRALVVEPLTGALMAGQALAASGTGEARACLAELIAGRRIVLLAYEEEQTRADPSRVSLRAEARGEGWCLNGSKALVHQAECADAFVIAARSGGEPGTAGGVSLFLVPAGTEGLQLRAAALVDGGRGAMLRCDGLRLPRQALLGPAGQGLDALERAVGFGVLALAAESLGAMEAAKGATLDYLRTRRQFGVPIGSFQALQHRMVDLLLEVEQARSSVINAAAALGDSRPRRERALSAAKHTVGRVGTLVAEESIQMHGGIGMTWELALAHYAKRLVMIDHELGDEDDHLARYLSFAPLLD
jgi:hypothetical protein